MVAGVLASLAELELELGRERRAAAKASRKARDLPIGRPRALSADQIALAERMRASGEPVPVIAETLGVSRATLTARSLRTWSRERRGLYGEFSSMSSSVFEPSGLVRLFHGGEVAPEGF
jgi:DNA invertase Pin-like site-specific DNA recombinase